MFYSTQILAKKGPLGIVWIAAHMESRLKRNNVYETNIPGSVDSILNPEAPLALRLSGQLLLGVVKIYDKKVLYLFRDCNEAITKMQQAFTHKDPTLRKEEKTALLKDITMPEDYSTFGDIHEDLPEEDFGLTFDPSQPAFALSSRDSFLLADDGTNIYTTPLSHHGDETFDVGGEELERHLSQGSAEQLRRASEPEVQRLFERQDDLTSPLYGQKDEIMPELPDDVVMTDMGPPPSAPPSTPHEDDHPLDGFDGLTPGGLDVPGQDEGLTLPELEVQQDSGRKKESEMPGNLATAQQKAVGKRKQPKKDVDADGQPATMFSSGTLRALLADRRPLLRVHNTLDKHELLSEPALNDFHVVNYSSGAGASWVQWPGISDVMAPALYTVYQHSIGTAGKSRQAKRRSRAANQEQPEEADAAEAAQDTHQDTAGPAQEPFGKAGFLDDGNHAAMPPEEGGFDMGAPDAEPYEELPMATMSDEGLLTCPGSTVSSPGSRRPSASRKRSERDNEEGDLAEAVASTPGSFTARTTNVLKQIKSKLGRVSETGKKQRLQGPASKGVSFQELHNGGNRTEAARLFFELLVLQARKKVVLSQVEPYAAIEVALQTVQ